MCVCLFGSRPLCVVAARTRLELNGFHNRCQNTVPVCDDAFQSRDDRDVSARSALLIGSLGRVCVPRTLGEVWEAPRPHRPHARPTGARWRVVVVVVVAFQ